MLLPTLFSLPVDVCLADVRLENEVLTLILKSSQTRAVCPECTHPSTRIRGRFTRTLADLPWKATSGAPAPGGAPLCVPNPGLSAYHLCRTLPDVDARICPPDVATSRRPDGGRVCRRRQSRCAVGEAPRDAHQPRYAPAAHPQHGCSPTQDPPGAGPRRFRLEKRRPLRHAAGRLASTLSGRGARLFEKPTPSSVGCVPIGA